jgi:hypothetical protein
MLTLTVFPPRGLLGVAGKIAKWVKSGFLMIVPIYAKVYFKNKITLLYTLHLY